MKKNSAQGPQNEIQLKKKQFFCQMYAIFCEKNCTICDSQVFFFISEGIEDFFSPETITDSPFTINIHSQFLFHNVTVLPCGC